MAETKILNLASFEDVETLKQTTKSQGEEISQVKQDIYSWSSNKHANSSNYIMGNVKICKWNDWRNWFCP